MKESYYLFAQAIKILRLIRQPLNLIVLRPHLVSGNKIIFYLSQPWTVGTLIGRFLSVVLRAVKEQEHLQGPVPIPHHPTVEKTAATWDHLRRQRPALNKHAVSSNSSCMFMSILRLRKVQF